MMKKSTFIIMLLLSFALVKGQEITEKHMDFSGKDTVNLNIKIADTINLHTWKKNEVFVRASVNINDNEDNDAYVIHFDESGDAVAVNSNFKDNYFKGRNNCCTGTDISWEIYIPENVAFTIETINGNIIIDGITDKIRAKSISGFIDLAVPSNRKADIKFSTITGTIYTDHKLALAPGHTGIPVMIKENLNSGGSLLSLETISGDIFFRRSDLK